MTGLQPMHVRNDVHWGKSGGILVFLDETSGRYCALDPQGSLRWERLFGESSSRPGTPSMPAASLGADDFDCLGDALDRGWLVPAAGPPPAPAQTRRPWRRLLRLRALSLLLGMHRRLRGRGLKSAYDFARRVSRDTVAAAAGEATTDALLHRFRAADRWVSSALGAEDCLPRSLALFVYLRGCGAPASHHVGVAQYPFRAHAWVEMDGVPLLDRPERVAEFATVAVLR